MVKSQTYHWTLEEIQKFDYAVKIYGRNWHLVSKALGGSRTPLQCRSHGQKALKKTPQAKQAEVFPKNEHRAACVLAGPFSSVGCQYGEGIRCLNVPLDEATWKEKVSQQCELLPAEDLYDLKVARPTSSQAISQPEMRKESVTHSDQVRDIGTQWVECQGAMTYEQWSIHSKHLSRKKAAKKA